jgi:hypothetical protein
MGQTDAKCYNEAQEYIYSMDQKQPERAAKIQRALDEAVAWLGNA